MQLVPVQIKSITKTPSPPSKADKLQSFFGVQVTSTNINAGVRSFINGSASNPFTVNKIWNGYACAEPYYQFYKADLSGYDGLAKVSNGGLGFNSYISNNFDLGKKWSAIQSTWFNYASRSSIYKTKAIYSIDLSVKKKIMNDKGTLTFAFRDLLKYAALSPIFKGRANKPKHCS